MGRGEATKGPCSCWETPQSLSSDQVTSSQSQGQLQEIQGELR